MNAPAIITRGAERDHAMAKGRFAFTLGTSDRLIDTLLQRGELS